MLCFKSAIRAYSLDVIGGMPMPIYAVLTIGFARYLEIYIYLLCYCELSLPLQLFEH